MYLSLSLSILLQSTLLSLLYSTFSLLFILLYSTLLSLLYSFSLRYSLYLFLSQMIVPEDLVIFLIEKKRKNEYNR